MKQYYKVIKTILVRTGNHSHLMQVAGETEDCFILYSRHDMGKEILAPKEEIQPFLDNLEKADGSAIKKACKSIKDHGNLNKHI